MTSGLFPSITPINLLLTGITRLGAVGVTVDVTVGVGKGDTPGKFCSKSTTSAREATNLPRKSSLFNIKKRVLVTVGVLVGVCVGVLVTVGVLVGVCVGVLVFVGV